MKPTKKAYRDFLKAFLQPIFLNHLLAFERQFQEMLPKVPVIFCPIDSFFGLVLKPFTPRPET